VHLAAILLLEVGQEVTDNRPAGWSVELRHRSCLQRVRRQAPLVVGRRWTLVGVVVEVCRRAGLRVSWRLPRQAVRTVTTRTDGRRSRLRQRADRSPPPHRRHHRRVQSMRSSTDCSLIVRLYKRRRDRPGPVIVPILIVRDAHPSVRYAGAGP